MGRPSAAESGHSEGDDRPAQSLQAEFRYRLADDASVDRRVRSLAEQDFAGVGAIAEPGGEDHDVADGAVVIAAFESDSSESRIAARDPHAEPEVVPALPPVARETSEALGRRHCGANRSELMVLDDGRVIEEGHQ